MVTAVERIVEIGITDNVVELMAAKIRRLEGEAQRHLSLAAARDLPDVAPDRPAPDEAPADERGRCRVLLAEDNQINQRVALKMLQRSGFQVDVVANGRAAINAL